MSFISPFARQAQAPHAAVDANRTGLYGLYHNGMRVAFDGFLRPRIQHFIYAFDCCSNGLYVLPLLRPPTVQASRKPANLSFGELEAAMGTVQVNHAYSPNLFGVKALTKYRSAL